MSFEIPIDFTEQEIAAIDALAKESRGSSMSLDLKNPTGREARKIRQAKAIVPEPPSLTVLATLTKEKAELLAERDQLAAQLEIARKALEVYAYSPEIGATFAGISNDALRQLSDPASALAEHDKRVAQRCAETAINASAACTNPDKAIGGLIAAGAIRREFELEANGVNNA